MLAGVVAADDTNADAHEALASSWMRRGRPDEALPHLKRFAELRPERYETLVQLGLVLADLGREDEARVYLVEFVTSAPDDEYGSDKAQVQEFIDELTARATTP